MVDCKPNAGYATFARQALADLADLADLALYRTQVPHPRGTRQLVNPSTKFLGHPHTTHSQYFYLLAATGWLLF